MAFLGFRALTKKLEERGDVANPRATAYTIGVKKYGKEEMRRRALAARRGRKRRI